MIIGFQKADTIFVKLRFSISKINTDTNLEEKVSQLCPVHATRGKNFVHKVFQLLGEKGGEGKSKT